MILSDGNKCPELKLSDEHGKISLEPGVNVKPI